LTLRWLSGSLLKSCSQGQLDDPRYSPWATNTNRVRASAKTATNCLLPVMPSPAGQRRLAQQEPCKRTIAFRPLARLKQTI
jgi:hypothetical protein